MKKQNLKRMVLLSMIGTPAILTTSYIASQLNVNHFSSEPREAGNDLIVGVSITGLLTGYVLGQNVSFNVKPIWKEGVQPQQVKWQIGVFYGNEKDPTFISKDYRVSFTPQYSGTYTLIIIPLVNDVEQKKVAQYFNVYPTKEDLLNDGNNTNQSQESSSGIQWWIWLIIALSITSLIGLILMFAIPKSTKKKKVKKQVSQIKQQPSETKTKAITTTKTVTVESKQEETTVSTEIPTDQAK